MSYIFTAESQTQVTGSIKKSVRIGSIADVDLLATHTTLDSISLNDQDRVLLKNQTVGAENGLYAWSSGTQLFSRVAGSADSLTSGALIVIEEGTSADILFILATNNPITVGFTSLTFYPITGAEHRLNISSQGLDGSPLIILPNDGINTLIVTSASAAGTDVTLPGASTGVGRVISVKRGYSGGNPVVIAAGGGDTIDGLSTQTLSGAFETLTFQSAGGTSWYII